MKVQTVLAFDVGDARVGVAVGNSLLREATPLSVMPAQPREILFENIGRLLKTWQVDLVVVGIARQLSGDPSAMTARCERFANQISGRFSIPVARVDERYSSLEAEALHRQARGAKLAKPRVALDDLAAAVILKRYFDESDAPA